MSIQAHPLLFHDIGNPSIVESELEYVVVINTEGNIYLFKTNVLNSTFSLPKKQQILSISFKVYNSPLIIGISGTSKVLTYYNKVFNYMKLPVFLIPKFSSIMNSKTVIISDNNMIFYWDLQANNVKFAFQTEEPILGLFSSSSKIFVFTTKYIIYISKENQIHKTQVDLSPKSSVLSSSDMDTFYSINGREIVPFFSDSCEIIPQKIVTAPDNFLCISSTGKRGRTLLAVFSTNDKKKRQIRKFSLGNNSWSSPVDTPLVSAICGRNQFSVGACSQYIIVFHEMPALFSLFGQSKRPALKSVLIAASQIDERDLLTVILIFFGFDIIVEELHSGDETYGCLVEVALDQLWDREQFTKWSELALKWPSYMRNQRSSQCIVELLKTMDLSNTPIVPFAAILEASGHPLDALLLYLKSKNGPSVCSLLPHVIDDIIPHIPELISFCIECSKKADLKTVSKIFQILADNHGVVSVDKIVALLTFDWTLLDLYYKCFETPPPALMISYINGIAIYKPNQLMSFLASNDNYNSDQTCSLLLRLGCLDEYGYILSQKYPEKYVEFLVFRENWKKLFDYLKEHPEFWKKTLELVSYEKSYFSDWSSHFYEMGIPLEEMIKSIPPTCPANLLSDGFHVITQKTSLKLTTESLVDEICAHEAFKLFQKGINQRTQRKVTKL